jgi:hypothetical protein
MARFVRNIVLFGGIFALASCSNSCPGQGPGPGPGTDNDRPPIIVSDGSVHLRVIAKDRGRGTNQSRGEWKPDGNLWFHDHGGPAAMNLAVNVLYGSGDSGCDNPESDFIVRELEVTYTTTSDTSGKAKFRVFIDAPNVNAAGRLAVASTATKDMNVKFWLDVGGAGDQLESVAFPSLGATCKLTPGKSQIHIYQSTKF